MAARHTPWYETPIEAPTRARVAPIFFVIEGFPQTHEKTSNQVLAVPGRAESLNAASMAIEAILDGVMRASFSIEERTHKRRMAALAKVMYTTPEIQGRKTWSRYACDVLFVERLEPLRSSETSSCASSAHPGCDSLWATPNDIVSLYYEGQESKLFLFPASGVFVAYECRKWNKYIPC